MSTTHDHLKENGIDIDRLAERSTFTQYVYYRGYPFYLWVIYIPFNIKFNLSVKEEYPLVANIVLNREEMINVYSENKWMQILRDAKLNDILL